MKSLFEDLESRRYLAVSLNPATRLLTITGGSRADVIRVAVNGVKLNVTLNGLVTGFALKNVGSILIDAQGNSDNVDIQNNVLLPATLLGGPGNDTLGGGGGDDDIDGGTGADVIAGGPGIDAVDYSSRTNPVTVGIGGLADDGEAGEKDNVQYDIEQIIGGSGDDTLNGSGKNNTLLGNGGNDLLNGAGGNDSLDGGLNDDTLRGGNGDDTFTGGAGSDWVDYSDHDAQVAAPGASLNLNIDDFNDSGLMKNFQPVEFDYIATDVENLTGSSGQDFITAFGDIDNRINARGGDDFVNGGDGNDSLDGGVGNDNIEGGAGNDVMVGGPDTIAAGQADRDFLSAEDGDDSILGGADNDTIIGAVGNDTARGGAGDDSIDGEVDADSLFGDAGNDTIRGGRGDDTIDGGDGVDSLAGEDDNDTIIDGGTIIPDDTQAEQSAQPLDAVVEPTDIDTLDGGGGDDHITGGAGQEFVFGGDGNDVLTGGTGSEQFDGGLGDDSIDAGDGQDTLIGGFGLDTLNGDAGNDVFANDDGQADLIDGGDDIDLVQFEPAGVDTFTNTEGVYDQPLDTMPGAALASPIDATIDAPPAPGKAAPLAAALPYAVVTIRGKNYLQISGELTTGGAAMDDNISLSQAGLTITLIENGNTYSISASGLSGIGVDGGAGSDFIAMATATGKSTINLPATLTGGRGDDVLRGGNGNDSITGGLGNDSLAGNNGNDVLNGGTDVIGQDADGRDTLMGGAGFSDAVTYATRSTSLSLSADGKPTSGASGEGDLICGDIEQIFGGNGDDTITGNNSANYLSGGNGADIIRGGGGNDTIIATTTSGDTTDTVYGDAGQDTFRLAGDGKADRYDIGTGEIESALFINKDPAPGGGFLDQPI